LILQPWLIGWQIKRFLYASSMSTYGDPLYLPVDENHPQQPKSFYAAGKIAAEAYIKLYQTLGIHTTVFRLFSVYGPGQNLANKMQGMVSIFLAYLLEEQPLIVKGSKERFRDFIYIDDVVDAWLTAWENPASYGKIYNVASGKKTRVEELLEILKSGLGCPNFPTTYQDSTPGDQFGILGDNNLLIRELHWQPKIELPQGIACLINFEKRRSSGA